MRPMDHYTLSPRALQVPATLVFGGVLLSLVVGLFHADGPANDHPVVFAEYAHSGAWIAVHLGQFVGMTIVAGLVALFLVFNGQPGLRDCSTSIGCRRRRCHALLPQFTGNRSASILGGLDDRSRSRAAGRRDVWQDRPRLSAPWARGTSRAAPGIRPAR